MTWFEAVIIYLAIGAPFGVHHFFSSRGDKILTRLVTSLFHFVSWVPFAVIAAAKALRPQNASEKLKKEIAFLQKEIERTDTGSVSIFEIRRVVERYVGLRSLTDQRISAAAADNTTIFDIAEHPDPELAVICLNRRNREHILRHQTDAAHDLRSLNGKMMAESSEPFRVKEIISKIAVLLDDRITTSELNKNPDVKDLTGEAVQWTELPKPPTNSAASIDLPIQ